MYVIYSDIYGLNKFISKFGCLFFLDIKLKRRFGDKDSACIVCNKMKRRNDVIEFVKSDYDFLKDEVQEAFIENIEKSRKKVLYVCRVCHFSLRGLRSDNRQNVYNEMTNPSSFLCTCCHKVFHIRKQVNLFKRKNYNFDNSIVAKALSKEVRCKCSIYEFICVECHGCLRSAKGKFPKFPKDAYCRKAECDELHGNCDNNFSDERYTEKCDKFFNENICDEIEGGENLYATVDWNDILRRMEKCCSFEELKRYVMTLKLPSLPKNFKGFKQLRSYRRDALAYSLLPSDVGVDRSELFPVESNGGGSCFYYSLSRLVYGNELHCIEMRVRVVHEGIMNMNLYLDHDYLCRNHDFECGSENDIRKVYASFSSFYQNGMSLDDRSIEKYYKREMFGLRKFSEYSGIWQFHQAANVLKCCVQSIYPHSDVLMVRNELNRTILPDNLDDINSVELVRIMWTKSTGHSFGFNHFVPVVDRDLMLDVVDVNTEEIVDNKVPIEVEIDLTEECSNDVLSLKDKATGCEFVKKCLNVNEGFVKKECVIDNESDGMNEFKFGKGKFLCTSCHKKSDNRKCVVLFKKSKFNFDLEVVRNVLSNEIRLYSDDGREYLCTGCYRALKDWNSPGIPKNSVFRKREQKKCSCCHSEFSDSSSMTLVTDSKYNFGCDIVKKVLSDDIRCYDYYGNEYVCSVCDAYLDNWNSPKIPEKCVYRKTFKDYDKLLEELEKRGKKIAEEKKLKNDEILKEEAGRKFRESCKHFPEFVCTVCHRMLFENSCCRFYINNYRKLEGQSRNVLDEKYRFRDSSKVDKKGNIKEFICKNCDRNLKKGELPAQAVFNTLEVPKVPDVLQGLTRLEVRCIALRIPFMNIRALRKGGLGKISGPCINVPASLEPIAEVLPRIPQDTELILLKFKRMLSSKRNYLCDYIRPQRVMIALNWLKKTNKLYKNIIVDEDWFRKFQYDDLYEEVHLDSGIEDFEESVKNGMDCVENMEKVKVDDVYEVMDVVENSDNVDGENRDDRMDFVDNVNIDYTEKGTCVEGEVIIYDDQNVDGDVQNDDIEEIQKVVEEKEEEKEEEEKDDDVDDDDDEANMREAQEEEDRRAEVRIGGSVTCMQIEDLDEVAFSIAPGEDSVPKYILTDEDFERLAFPDLFPLGSGDFDINLVRESELNLRRYVNQRLLNKDARFSQNMEYIFAFQYATEIKQLKSDMQMALKRRNKDGKRITAGDLKNFQIVNQMVYKDIAYKFMKKVRGTPAYWQSALMDTLAMLRTFGTPTWFLSLSPAEFLWPEFTQAVGKKIWKNWTLEDVMEMDWETKASNFRKNPLPVDQMFGRRLENFFKYFLMSKAHPLGHITEHIEKIEFQARGSPHAHCLLWVKDAPKVDKESDEKVCEFVDKYVNGRIPCDFPENELIRGLVKKLQTHNHSPFCRPHVKARCRFNFPRPPCPKTIIARNRSDDLHVDIDEKVRQHIMEIVHERISKEDGSCLKDILESENIPEDMYVDCLRLSGQRGTTIILKRDIDDTRTNNCNLDCLNLWNANMDIQYVADAYACIMYVLSYVMKCERGMSEILKRVAKEYKDECVQRQMKEVLHTFSNKREVSIHEAIYRVTSQWLFRKSRSVVYVSNAPEDERHRMPKHQFELVELKDEDENVFQVSIHDRYASRPDDLEDMCLAVFATRYNITSKNAGEKNVIELKDPKLGRMIKRGRDCVLRNHRYNEDNFRYYYSKLLMFWPWRNEKQLIEGYRSYQDHYFNVIDIVEKNASEFNLNSKEIDDAIEEFESKPPTVSDWIDAGIGLEYMCDEDLADDIGGSGKVNDEVVDVPESTLCLKYRYEAQKDVLSSEEYCRMMRSLNKEQREIVMFNRSWIKESICKIKRGDDPESYQVFLSGPGGSGKSHVIKMVHCDNVKFYRRFFIGRVCDSGEIVSCSDSVISLLCAYTGTAAFNIDGMTLHSAFQLHCRNISDERKTTMIASLGKLQLLVIDEVSMVGRNHFEMVNKRCSMIKHRNCNDLDFGKVNVLAVGDFYQLDPVGQCPVFVKNLSSAKCPSDLGPNVWDKFLFHELTQVMRQKDVTFSDMLNIVRVTKPEKGSEVDCMLKARELNMEEDDPNYPDDVLHVYARNEHCSVRNEKMLNKIDGSLYSIKADDSLKDIKVDMSQVDLSLLPASKTGNLPRMLLLKVGARVFVSSNIDVSDGLTNGVFGTVSHIISSTYVNEKGESIEEVRVVLVRFDSDRVGREAKAKSLFKRIDADAVPISKAEVAFKTSTSDHRKSVSIIRKQFPLILSWAVTIHKVQGMTMDRIVVDMSKSKGKFMKGQAYVAFSRVRTYDGLHLINYDRDQIKVCGKVKKEMERLRRDRRLPLLDDGMIWSMPKESVCILHLNVQGLSAKSRSKYIDLKEDKELQKADIVCFTETHYCSENEVNVSSIWEKNGCMYRLDRSGRKGGGVLIAVCDKYKSKRVCFESHLEAIAIELYCPDRIVLICMYLSPSVNKKAAVKCIEKLLCDVSDLDDKVIIVGDFNEDLLSDTGDKSILNCLQNCGFKQHVYKATTDYGSLLDHVYTRKVKDVGIDVLDTYYSDHDRVFCFFQEYAE